MSTPPLPGTGLAYLPSSSNTTFDFVYTAPGSGVDSTHAFTVSATDLAGNVANGLAGRRLALDLTTPAIGAAHVAPAVVNSADVSAAHAVTVTFTVSEAQASGYPQVRVGNSTASCSLTQSSASGVDYTCSYTAVSVADGVKLVTITAVDLAGNSSADTTQGVT